MIPKTKKILMIIVATFVFSLFVTHKAGFAAPDDGLFVDPGGNVGIGTTTPTSLLQLMKDGLSSPIRLEIFNTGTTNADDSILSFKTGSSFEFGMGIDSSTGWFTITKGNIFGTDDIFTIDVNGNIGIGTTSPAEKLDVAGSVKAAMFIGDGSSLTNISFVETDPVYSAWDKSFGISITESQISDLAHTTDTTLDQAGVEGLGFVTGSHTVKYTDAEAVSAVGPHTVNADTHIDKTGIEGFGFVDGAHTVDTTLDQVGVEGLGFVTGAHTVKYTDAEAVSAVGPHTVDTDTHIDKTGIEGFGFVDGAHTVDTTLDQAGVEGLGFVTGSHTVKYTDSEAVAAVGPHTVDTDTHIDKTGIESLGFVDGAHTVDTTLDQAGVEGLGFVTGSHTVKYTDAEAVSAVGPHTVNTDTHIDKTGIEGLGFVDGAHTVDTTLDQAGVEGLGFVTGSHTVDTDTHIDKTGIEGLGFVDGVHTVDTTLDQAGVKGLGFVTGPHTIDTDTHIDKTGIEGLGFVDGAHTVDTTLDQAGVKELGFVTGSHTARYTAAEAIEAVEPILAKAIQKVKKENKQLRIVLALLTDRVIALEKKHKKKKKHHDDDGSSDDRKKKKKK